MFKSSRAAEDVTAIGFLNGFIDLVPESQGEPVIFPFYFLLV